MHQDSPSNEGGDSFMQGGHPLVCGRDRAQVVFPGTLSQVSYLHFQVA